MTGRVLLLCLLFNALIASTIFANVSNREKAIDTLAVDSSLVKINEINITGNKKTKAFVIFRELEFSQGQSMQLSSLDTLISESINNLQRTPLFNFVYINKEFTSADEVNIEVKVVERWYIWPIPVFRIADRNINEWWRRRDFSRVDYGIFFNYYNFRGRNELLRLLTQFGYEELFELTYRIPYINKAKTLGVEVSTGFSNLREIAYNTQSDTLSRYVDRNNFPQKNQFADVGLVYRPNFNNAHSFNVRYAQYQFADTLLKLNPKFSLSGDESKVFSLAYKFKSDFRDQKSYPLDGYMFEAELGKFGLGIFEEEPDFWRLNSNFDWYQPLSRRFFFSSNLSAMFEFGSLKPYFLQSGLGYGNQFIRGYEHYVMQGDRFGLWKNNLKFALIPQRDYTMSFLKSEKFNKIHYALYMNAFVDLGYVNNDMFKNNELNNRLIYGYGMGLDFVTYYDVVLRVEYSFNLFHQSGFYVHFTAPI